MNVVEGASAVSASMMASMTMTMMASMTMLLVGTANGFAFVPLPLPSTRINNHQLPTYQHQQQTRTARTSSLFMAINDDTTTSNDPFQILGLTEPTADPKVIKRAYKRMALKFHPDMTTTTASSPEEKKAASDRFAKINWAYETLSGKRQNDSTYGKAKTDTSQKSTSSSSSDGWTPPHRRTGSYASSRSTDWKDYMPKYDETDYDTNGDSFGSIFRDLFVGAAAGATTGGGVFRDFVEFLENNVDGYTSGTADDDDDTDLRVVLQTGTIDDVAEEMDDTQLVIDQLKTKSDKVQEEILMLQADVGLSTRYMERIEMEERLAELEARKEIVAGYIKKSQARLLKLQTRYKELITSGQNDYYTSSRGRTRPSSSYDDRSSSTSTNASTNTGARDNNARKREGFGSSGRGASRGSARRRSTSRRTETSARSSYSPSSSSGTSSTQERPSSSSYRSPPPPPPRRTETSRSYDATTPPHRRKSSFEAQAEDKRRMREMKVDEDFEKLKKDLGL